MRPFDGGDEGLRLLPDGLYPKALYPIRRNHAVCLSKSGWYAWPIWQRHGHQWPMRIDGYAATDCLPGQFVRLLPVPTTGE